MARCPVLGHAVPVAAAEEVPGPGVGVAGGHHQDAARREDVLAALRRLSAEQRAALVLHHVDGLSVREVARQLDRSESAVESLLARARRRFRQLYEGQDHD